MPIMISVATEKGKTMNDKIPFAEMLEVPLEECGLHGKILAKRRAKA